MLLSVNVSLVKTVDHHGKEVTTGIFKRPIAGAVMVRTLNLDGDAQADLRVHGGPHRAVYAYPHEHYAYWARELERDGFPIGQFGENLTVEGLVEEDVCIGDRFRIGGADGPLLEVSQPRPPCFKMAMAIGEPRFPRKMVKSGRSGFYLRVIEEGLITAGVSIETIARDSSTLSVHEAMRLMYRVRDDYDGVRRALRAGALSPGWRKTFESRLAEAPSRGH